MKSCLSFRCVGKCTVDDVDFISVGQPYGFLSPSGLGKVVVSVEDCKTLMGRSLEETLGLLLGDRKAEDTNKNKMGNAYGVVS